MNTNISYNTNFKLVFSQAPEVDFFIQSLSMPSVALGEVQTPYKSYDGYTPGNQIVYEPLNLSMLLSEDMSNYFYILDWLDKCAKKNKLRDQYKDISLLILNNNKLNNREIVFQSAFPTSITELSLGSNVGDITPTTFSVTIRYQTFIMRNRVDSEMITVL